MNRSERLVLAYKAFDDQLRAAKAALEELFREPIRGWVERFKDREVVVGDCVKAFIRKVNAHDEVDGPSVQAAMVDAVTKGAFSHRELLDMFAKGVLVPMGNEAAAKMLYDKGVCKPGTCTVHVPEGWTNELRFSVTAKGRFEGLCRQLKGHTDIEGAIRKAAAGIDRIAELESQELEQGKVAIPGLKKAKN